MKVLARRERTVSKRVKPYHMVDYYYHVCTSVHRDPEKYRYSSLPHLTYAACVRSEY